MARLYSTGKNTERLAFGSGSMTTIEDPRPGENPGIRVVRLLVAATMAIHGITRVVIGGVEGFGGFLTSSGFPLGSAIAWAITLFEIAGSLALALRVQPTLVATAFALELVMGIVLVHAPEGWFVVGAGRNGMEYSVVLVGCCVAVVLAERSRRTD
jgi:putative oxidoreductase